jgi:hypothetical protein
LAGDVLVSVVAGNLIVQGDDLDNQIAITAGEQPGSYVVAGLGGTLVHLADGTAGGPANAEAPDVAVVVEGVQRGARIAMGDGNDTVALNRVAFRGDVALQTEGGDDRVLIGAPLPEPPGPPPAAVDEALSGEVVADPPPEHRSVAIGGSLRIGTGEGNDRVVVGHALVRGQLAVATGIGDDHVVLGAPPADTSPPDPVAADATAGTANTNGQMPLARRALRVGGAIHVRLGAGQDSLVADQVAARAGLLANGGDGDDVIGVRHANLGGLLSIFGGLGDGADRVVMDHVRAELARIATGAGSDEVHIVDSVFGMLGVGLGDGDDSLAVHGNTARAAVLLGGEGQDTLLGLGDNRFGRQLVRGFELPEMPPDSGGMAPIAAT